MSSRAALAGDEVGKACEHRLEELAAAPLCSVEANDRNDDEADDNGVINDTRLHYEYVVYEPECRIYKRIEAAYCGVLLYDRESEEPSGDTGEDIKGRGEEDHRDNGVADGKEEGQPDREILTIRGEGKADNGLHDGEEDDPARGGGAAEYCLHAKKSVCNYLRYENDPHILKLHTCYGKYCGKNGYYVARILLKKF